MWSSQPLKVRGGRGWVLHESLVGMLWGMLWGMFRTRTTTDEQLHFSRGAAREDRPHLQLGKPECDQSVRASQQREDRQENHQADNRYSHVPSILEMIGIPYVASGPLAHSLALDKVVTKMILRQHNIPTPDFAVLN